jgi:SAM-dependent methyltransferase
MHTTEEPVRNDLWSDWLLDTRFAGNEAFRKKVMGVVESIRDRVLDGARLQAGATLLDIGAGDGLIGLGAIDRIGPSLRVIMTDISEPLLARAREHAKQLHIDEQCTFLQVGAESLSGVADASVDVVTSRAVLAYVPGKFQAFCEFFRVLRPGGRISIGEPIFQDEAFEAVALTRLIGAQPGRPDIEFLRLLQRIKAAQFPCTEEAVAKNPLTNFSERDLVRLVGSAGFINPHAELHIDLHRGWITNWDIYLDSSPHPLAKSLREVFAENFSPDERSLFERIVRPQIESGKHVGSDVIAYLTAVKPAP